MAEIVLVVEDEPSLQETLVYNLEKEGYAVEANIPELISCLLALKC